MKKIAILTLRLNNNYGGLLQAYALNTYLRQLGYDAYTLDVREEILHIPLFRRIITVGWRAYKKLKGEKSIHFLDIQEQLKVLNTPGKEQVRFIHDHIRTIEVQSPINDNFQNECRFDCYIVGSDQVWRKAFVANLSNYFLDFVPEDVLKVSYAASFGIDSFEANSDEKMSCARLLSRFRAVSVRENDAVPICKDLTPQKNIEWVIDPTLLLKKEEYEQLIPVSIPNKTGILLVYILDVSSSNESIVKYIADKLNLPPFYIGKLDKGAFPSVESWLAGFRDADFVVTDSFHGSVFSLIFNKPFVSISNKGRGESRFSSLFQMFNLKDRLIENITDLKTFDKGWFTDSIDFDLINVLIQKQQERSKDFLIKSIEDK